MVKKLINLFEDGFNFFTFVDTLQIDERLIRLIETKATTSRKFLKLAYKHDKEEQAFFVMTPEGNLVLREEIAGLSYILVTLKNANTSLTAMAIMAVTSMT